ncbi:discoidin domain-containing protein [Shewanella sp. JM162201]|uniref:Discoidin domain-containing protein n=1 Tax=Shewanella jiangmenensis TaxID=2837387 RepID=A0ABS5V6A7_9GAMM|nr:discoidin domain-containing protein [Shewanella jiangmenensis]MBT1445352.1 discoidin domain-containing protein [Shewanella jiangmenensis]
MTQYTIDEINKSYDIAIDILNENPSIHFKGVISNTPLTLNVNSEMRFLLLSLQIETCFHLDFIKIFDVNGEPILSSVQTKISSFFNDDVKHAGIDLLNGHPNGGCGFHTKNEHSPWFFIDLGELKEVKEIQIFNRDDKFYLRALSLKVDISSNLSQWTNIYDALENVKKVPNTAENKLVIAFLESDLLIPTKISNILSDKGYFKDSDACRNHVYTLVNKLVEKYNVALCSHGFVETFNFSSDIKKNIIYSELSTLLSWFNNEFNISAFVSSGTLLGIVRDGKFIDHDDDVDICYISNEIDERLILQERIQIINLLIDKGCEVQFSNEAHLWCTMPNGTSVDIFTGFIEDGFCSMNPFSRKSILANDILPTKLFYVDEFPMFLPSNPEVVLDANYDNNWRVPDPLWRFDWSNAYRSFKFLYEKLL